MKKLKNKIADMLENHITIGNLTIYGDNAMHFGCIYWTNKFGYICFRLPIFCGISDKLRYGNESRLYWKPLYFYISRNATPWASVFFIGRKHNSKHWSLARVRKRAFGWNYDNENEYHHSQLWKINDIL